MILRATIRNRRLTLTYARIAKVIGVNSNLGDGKHVLMWDFDDIELRNVRTALWLVQDTYQLSDIHLLRTKKPHNYIAYCFTALEWRQAVEVIAATRLVDWQFFRFGVYRGHFTLRVTPKGDRGIQFVEILSGETPPNCTPSDLLSWVKYETLSWR